MRVVAAESTDGFCARHPRGDELLLAVEVADSSSRQDLTTKRDLYARAGAPVYWVLDIVGRRLIAHRLPVNGRYEEVQTVQEDGTISLDGQQLAIARLLPPALA